VAELEVPEGVQAFNFWTISIMARLWEEFPRPQFFSLRKSDIGVSRNYSEVGAPIGPTGPDQVELFRHTMNWLESEGFVSSGADGQWASNSVRLTVKGFSVLNEIPRSIASKPDGATGKSLGNLMRETVVKEAFSVAGRLIQSMLMRPGDNV
jgi:hypothetical protein